MSFEVLSVYILSVLKVINPVIFQNKKALFGYRSRRFINEKV